MLIAHFVLIFVWMYNKQCMIYYYGQRIIVILEVQYYENVRLFFIFLYIKMVCDKKCSNGKFVFNSNKAHKENSIKTIQVVTWVFF